MIFIKYFLEHENSRNLYAGVCTGIIPLEWPPYVHIYRIMSNTLHILGAITQLIVFSGGSASQLPRATDLFGPDSTRHGFIRPDSIFSPGYQ